MSECVSKNWKPGWLMRISHQAHISCMADHNPAFFGPNPPKFKAGEEREIFDRMDERFKKWTGKTIAEHIAAGIPCR